MKRLLILTVLCLCVRLSYADEMFNYGLYWSLLPPQAQRAYVDGVADGVFRTYFAAMSAWLPDGDKMQQPESAKAASVRKAVFLMLDKASIIAVMTDLYKDPANTFIDSGKLLYIARDKLLGEKVEDQLIQARKRAVEDHALMEKANAGK